MDPDAIFVLDLQDANKFFCYYFLKVHLHHFLNMKVIKKSQNSTGVRNNSFSYHFCLMIEGSRSGARSGARSGSVPLTNGSGFGSRRPKNIRIIQIRIHNTGFHNFSLLKISLFSSSKSGSKLFWKCCIRIRYIMITEC
jgi:hypothetical protein